MNKRKCQQCLDTFEGRTDKIFCSEYCRSTFHYLKNKSNPRSLFKVIDDHLKTNRRLLSKFNKAGKAVVRKEDIEKEGFNPKFFTHFWKNQKGDVYLFCYEFGFLKKVENGRTKYVLVKWQSYMN